LGAIDRATGMTPKPKTLTRRDRSLIEAADIFTDAPTDKDLAFLTRCLVQCTLPHKNPGNVEAWQRDNGNLSLVIRPGWDTKNKRTIGYPYGSIPRLVLYWITTEAARTKSRRLELGNSLAGFMRQVGLNPDNGTGRGSDARRLREQMERLFQATISFDRTVEEGGRSGHGWLNMQVAPEGELWWNPKDPHTATLWGSWIELGQKFFEAATTGLIPLDTRALRKLKRSPLDLDLYAWCAYNAFRAHNKGEAVWITWRKLAQALGADYSSPKHFQQKASKALARVRTVFPGLNYETHRAGFTILPTSSPPVLEKRIVDKSGD
jgi:Plasmid encoded RepA protein